MKRIFFVLSPVLLFCSEVICQNTVEVKGEVNILVENLEQYLNGESGLVEYTLVRSQLESGYSREILSVNGSKAILWTFHDNDWNVETTSYCFRGGQKHTYLVRKGRNKKLEFQLYLISERRYFEYTHGSIKKIPNEIFNEIIVLLSYDLDCTWELLESPNGH